MIKRLLEKKLIDSLNNSPAVVLLGARQVGKTTLAKVVSKKQKSIYLDLESSSDLLKLSDPEEYLSSHSDKLVILDEIQNSPDLFKILRGLIDKSRRRGRKFAQYLILGSSSLDLIRQSTSLAGRVLYLELNGLNLLEIERNNKKLWLRGGFPESFLSKTDKSAMEWVHDFIKTYLQRDVPQMGFRIPSSRLRRLWTMLAHLQGECINYQKLASNLELDGKTIKSYIDILEDLLLIRKVEPWHVNLKKRLIKSPRYYVRDSGVLHNLLNIDNFDSLLSNPILGKSFEGFVLENICSVLPKRSQIYFYRTSAGAEIDLLIKFSNQLWAIEIKYGNAPKLSKNFYKICNDVKANKKFVIYGGNDEFSIGNGVTMVSLRKFMNKLKE